MTPITLKDCEIQVPCGKCPLCLARRASGWSFRLMQEERNSSSAFFLTLTYDTVHVPITDRGFMNLSKRDCQLFLKRLRKVNPEKLKYYLAGEYGGITFRPHYHMILFNAKLDTIQDAWRLGQIHYGNVSGASVGYTLKYISKPGRIPWHKNDDRQPEFSLMSKGLGKSYLTDAAKKWHKEDLVERMYLNIEDGKKIGMPRYYKDKLYTDDERTRIANAFEAKMVFTAKEQSHEEYRNYQAAIKAAFERLNYLSTKNQKL